MISLSYSRISLADIAQKLQLDSPEDAEFIVAKVTSDSDHHAAEKPPALNLCTPTGLVLHETVTAEPSLWK